MVGIIYRLTSSGRKVASSTNPNRRDDVMDYLYRQKNGCTLEELSAVTGMPKGTLQSIMAKYKARGYISSDSGIN